MKNSLLIASVVAGLSGAVHAQEKVSTEIDPEIARLTQDCMTQADLLLLSQEDISAMRPEIYTKILRDGEHCISDLGLEDMGCITQTDVNNDLYGSAVRDDVLETIKKNGHFCPPGVELPDNINDEANSENTTDETEIVEEDVVESIEDTVVGGLLRNAVEAYFTDETNQRKLGDSKDTEELKEKTIAFMYNRFNYLKTENVRNIDDVKMVEIEGAISYYVIDSIFTAEQEAKDTEQK